MTANDNHACPAEMTNFCAQRHWAIYWILIVCSAAMITGNVLRVGADNGGGDSPFFSANDRSRWCTVRSLAEHGTYEIDEVVDSVSDDPQNGTFITYYTIDKVKHVGADGKMHQYSSKPTLFPTMLAGGYSAIRAVTGMDLETRPFVVARLMLLLFNVVPWIVFLYFLSALIDRVGVRDWTRYFVLGVAGFGTYLTTFAVTLNNHVPAAISVMIALYCIAEIFRQPLVGEKQLRWRDFIFAGLFAAFAAANELPALSFFAVAGMLCLISSFRMTLIGFVPAALVVAAGFFGTNWLAHGDWRPAYTHRNDGAAIATVEFNEQLKSDLDSGTWSREFSDAVSGKVELGDVDVETGKWAGTPETVDRWVIRDRGSAAQLAVTLDHGGDAFQIRSWNNWYDYRGSYWTSARKSDVDRGQPSRLLYAFHVLFGHHGIFSLTPIWLLSFAGMFSLVFSNRLQIRWIGLTTILLTVVVTGFYIMRPEHDRNYGGVTSALRWLFWLAPLWLVAMLPVVDWLGRTRTGRAICFLLLAVSAVSAYYAVADPWVHPWLYRFWEYTGIPV